jgi:hypothetical protein
MSLVSEIENFVARHGRCGGLVGDATPPTEAGYCLWIACSCGARLEHWVTPEAAERDLIYTRLGVFPN